MAKKRRRRTTRSVSPMSARPRRRRRRSSLSASHRARPRKRRRSRGLSDGPKKNWGQAVMASVGGASGGALYIAPKFLFTMPWYGKLIYGTVLSVGAHKFGFPNVGSGAAGAMVQDLATQYLGTSLKDLTDTEYVDPNTLNDTDLEDEHGNAVLSDDDGILYVMNDDGDAVAIGDAYSLAEGSNLQNVSMLPLQDPYALQGSGAYALASGY